MVLFHEREKPVPGADEAKTDCGLVARSTTCDRERRREYLSHLKRSAGAESQLFENGSLRLTNWSIDVLKRDGTKWKIMRSFTIPKDNRTAKPSCDVALTHVSPDTFTGAAREVWQTLMRWRDSYNARDLG